MIAPSESSKPLSLSRLSGMLTDAVCAACILLPTLACTSSPPPLDLPTCGEPGPVQILAGAEDDHVSIVGETAERFVVKIGQRAASVGKCGEDPQILLGNIDLSSGTPGPSKVLFYDEDGIWVVQERRVGLFPHHGGEVAWLSEMELPVGLVRDRGFVVVDTATQDAQLVASDGTRRTVLQGVVLSEDIDHDPRLFQLQSVDGVMGLLDDTGRLQVVDLDDGQVAHVVPGVSSFSLQPYLDVRVPGGPDGSWFFTGEGGGGSLSENPVRFYVRGTAEVIDLQAKSVVSPTSLNPSGWMSAEDEHGATKVFDARTRRFVEFPFDDAPIQQVDYEGGIYRTDLDTGVVMRFDVFTGELEEVAVRPEGYDKLGGFAHEAMLWYRTGRTAELVLRDAEFTVVPLRGDAWTVPGRADVAWLVPGGVVYTPTEGSEPAEAGPLLWVDAQGDPREIDPAAWLGAGVVPIHASEVPIHDGDLFFRVHDGDRSGLWRAVLP